MRIFWVENSALQHTRRVPNSIQLEQNPTTDQGKSSNLIQRVRTVHIEYILYETLKPYDIIENFVMKANFSPSDDSVPDEHPSIASCKPQRQALCQQSASINHRPPHAEMKLHWCIALRIRRKLRVATQDVLDGRLNEWADLPRIAFCPVPSV